MVKNCTDTFQMAQTVAFHLNKCKSMEHGKSRAFTEYKMRSSSDLITLDQIVSEKDLSVILDPSLKFREDISYRVNKANRMMGIIRRSFSHLNANMFKIMYKALVQPQVYYNRL